MIRNQKSYEDARDTAQFNGMSVSSGRKSSNVPYKREPLHFASHQLSPGNLHDGMSYPGTNTLPLSASAAPVAIPSGPSPLTHTSQFLQGTSLATASAHPTAATTYLTSHGQATSTQTPLSLPSHSQGPTPANTPPNDPKGPNQYQQQNFAMNHLQIRTVPPAAQPLYHIQPNSRTSTARGPHQPLNRNVFYVAPPYPAIMLSNHMNQITNTSLMPQQQFLPPSTSSEQQHNMFYSSSAAPSAGYPPNYQISRANWNRSGATSQPAVNMPHHSNIISSAPMYTSMTPGPAMTQPQQQQQQQQFSTKSKKREHALPIIHPETGEEVIPDSEKPENENNKMNDTKNKDTAETDGRMISEFRNEVSRRATEPSSNYSSTSASSPAYMNKETCASIINGAVPTVSFVPQQAANDWKPPLNTPSNINTISDQVDPLPNSLKHADVSSAVHSTKMDYKRPTREDQNLPANVLLSQDEGKSRDRETITSWPESSPIAPPRVTGPPQPAPQRVQNINKKTSKETENSISGSNLGSPMPSPSGSAKPSLTVSQDGLNKEATVTSNSIVLDNNSESTQKSVTKQGIQSSVVTQAAEEVPPSKPSTATKQMPTASSAPLPSHVSLPVNVPLPAQNTTSKAEVKSQTTVSEPVKEIPSGLGNVSTQNVKSAPTSATQTSVPPIEKPTSVLTQSASSNVPLPSKGTSAVSGAPLSPSEEKVTAKEEKTNPSTKQKNRGKEPSNENTNADHQSSGSKAKAAQSFSKHHNVDPSKPSNLNAPPSASTKQINGEMADPPASEGKSNKKGSKKKKDINKKGSEKEGSDMDMFTSIEKAPINTEKNRSAEKVSQPNVTRPVSINANANRKTNSSQKSNDEIKENINVTVESKEKESNNQNIPSIPVVPVAASPDTNKTEQICPSNDKPKRKKYDVNYLLSLSKLPQCNVAVKLYTEFQLLKTQMVASRNASQNGFPGMMFQPAFMNQAASRSSQISVRKSQTGMKRDRPNQIHVSLSLKDDIPLRSSKDAWKPARFNPDVKNLSADEKKTEELYKTVRGILNKLTPENFPKLIERIKALPIDSDGRLQGVIDLIFQKAIDEPGFCKWYAEMCRVMQSISVPDEKQKEKSFRTVLITKCQHQFESDKADELDAEKKQQEIAKCTDPEKKKELQLLFEETERKIRRKSVGNCRFIGELFKLQMLTAKIMIRCVMTLLSRIEEESLECLCKLLTTIGKDLEAKLPSELDKHFTRMQEIADQKKCKVSSRIRFMLQDVIDLRKNQWVPRREGDNPKTIDQINQELEKKEHDIKMANLLPRKQYDDNYNNRGRDHKKNSRNDNKSMDDWHTVPIKNNSYTKINKVDHSKLKQIFLSSNDTTEFFGAPASFNNWRTGVSSANSKPVDKKTSGALYSSLSLPPSSRNMPSKLTPSNSSEKPRPFPPMQRDNNNDAGKISRSSSSQSVNPVSRESSVQRTVPPQAPESLSRQDISKYCKTMLEEYFLNNDLKDSVDVFQERFAYGERVNSSQIIDVLEEFINVTTEHPKLANHGGKLMVALLQKKIISQEHIIITLENIIGIAEDILVDCPLLWTYLADTLCPLFNEDCLSYSDFETAFVEKLPDQQNGPLLTAVTKLLNSSKIEKPRNPVNEEQRIFKFLSEKLNTAAFENITKWIDENVENSRNNPKLVSALTEVVCEFSLKKYEAFGGNNNEKESSKELNDEFLKYSKFFKLYIENKEELEMQCLYSVQKYAREKNYPKGFLLQMFLALYENKSVSFDSFIAWKKASEALRNESNVGVAILSLRSFFEYLTENYVNQVDDVENKFE